MQGSINFAFTYDPFNSLSNQYEWPRLWYQKDKLVFANTQHVRMSYHKILHKIEPFIYLCIDFTEEDNYDLLLWLNTEQKFTKIQMQSQVANSFRPSKDIEPFILKALP